MRKIISISSVSLLLLAPFAWPQDTKTPVSPRGPSVAAGSHGLVVSGKPAATAAGVKILERGGNAADAGAATLFALSVTYVGTFGPGGGLPAIPRRSPGTCNTESRTVTSRRRPCLAP